MHHYITPFWVVPVAWATLKGPERHATDSALGSTKTHSQPVAFIMRPMPEGVLMLVMNQAAVGRRMRRQNLPVNEHRCRAVLRADH